jgi:hypothetical protein
MAFVIGVTLKMKATCPSETSLSVYKTTWCHNPEDLNLMKHHSENPKNLNLRLSNLSSNFTDCFCFTATTLSDSQSTETTVATTTVGVHICVFQTEEGTSACVQLALRFMLTGMLHILHSSPSILRMIKPRMRWTGNVARI